MKKILLLCLTVVSIGSLYAVPRIPSIEEFRLQCNVENVARKFQEHGIPPLFVEAFPQEVPKVQAAIDRLKSDLTAHEMAEAECVLMQYGVLYAAQMADLTAQKIAQLSETHKEKIDATILNGEITKFVAAEREKVKTHAAFLGVPLLEVTTKGTSSTPEQDTIKDHSWKDFFSNRKFVAAGLLCAIVGIIYYNSHSETAVDQL